MLGACRVTYCSCVTCSGVWLLGSSIPRRRPLTTAQQRSGGRGQTPACAALAVDAALLGTGGPVRCGQGRGPTAGARRTRGRGGGTHAQLSGVLRGWGADRRHRGRRGERSCAWRRAFRRSRRVRVHPSAGGGRERRPSLGASGGRCRDPETGGGRLALKGGSPSQLRRQEGPGILAGCVRLRADAGASQLGPFPPNLGGAQAKFTQYGAESSHPSAQLRSPQRAGRVARCDWAPGARQPIALGTSSSEVPSARSAAAST